MSGKKAVCIRTRRLAFIRELIAEAREWRPDVLLAVGGGSVIDTVKAASMGIPYDGDVWDFFIGRAVCEKATPISVILTIPGPAPNSPCASW